MNTRDCFTATLIMLSFISAGCSSSPETTRSAGETSTASGSTVGTAKPINTMCPVMHYPVNPKYNVTFKEKTIGLCCDACVEMWGKMTDDERDVILKSVGIVI